MSSDNNFKLSWTINSDTCSNYKKESIKKVTIITIYRNASSAIPSKAYHIGLCAPALVLPDGHYLAKFQRRMPRLVVLQFIFFKFDIKPNPKLNYTANLMPNLKYKPKSYILFS